MCKWRTMPWRRLWTKFKVNWTHHWMRKNRNVKFWTLLQDNSATICILWVHFITNLLQCSILNEKRRYSMILFFATTMLKQKINYLAAATARFFLRLKRTTLCVQFKTNYRFVFLFMTRQKKDKRKPLQNSLTLFQSWFYHHHEKEKIVPLLLL